jgi:hypothetical protein
LGYVIHHFLRLHRGLWTLVHPPNNHEQHGILRCQRSSTQCAALRIRRFLYCTLGMVFRQVQTTDGSGNYPRCCGFHVSGKQEDRRSLLIQSGLLICVTTVTHKNLVALTCKLEHLQWMTILTTDIGTCFAAGGLFCLSPACTVWAGLNTAGQTKRAIGISIVVVFSQFGGLVGSNIYLASEKRESSLRVSDLWLNLSGIPHRIWCFSRCSGIRGDPGSFGILVVDWPGECKAGSYD